MTHAHLAQHGHRKLTKGSMNVERLRLAACDKLYRVRRPLPFRPCLQSRADRSRGVSPARVRPSCMVVAKASVFNLDDGTRIQDLQADVLKLSPGDVSAETPIGLRVQIERD